MEIPKYRTQIISLPRIIFIIHVQLQGNVSMFRLNNNINIFEENLMAGKPVLLPQILKCSPTKVIIQRFVCVLLTLQTHALNQGACLPRIDVLQF